ncbi:MAG TPA: hypothetical protein VEP66_08655 [Myxococcales bacterium]|nr:hypothetical protein [Myxococcales bacterium]
MGASLLAAQTVHVPLFTSAAAASCCCRHKAGDAHCACPVCVHARETQSGKPFYKNCAPASGVTALAAKEAAVPTAVAAPSRRSRQAPAQVRIASPPEDPPLDVPTPPPLARG